ncbi:hypothetical protein BP6252_05898 [Coleophoma cylindrospora]|uniref:Uncharacterized protein n=1 Tax=Coleophoma cylindrospora TaxID=1849047 RepID=A0A3D8RLF1_9HELO|nr:hypothetical protein BP6252_05898 [Coleophoma cylindrospora]
MLYIPELLEKKLLSTRQQHHVISTLLEATCFSDLCNGSSWRFGALELAEKMLATSPDESFETYAAIRRMAMTRIVLGTVHEESKSLLERVVTSPRSNALYWKVRLSKAQDYNYRDDFVGAQREVSGYKDFNSTEPSMLEQRLGREIRSEHARFVLITYLAGAHCELGNPGEALKLIRSTLESSQTNQWVGRLYVALAEGLLHAGMRGCTFDPVPSMEVTAQRQFLEAKSICETAVYRYRRANPNGDISTQYDKATNLEKVNYLRLTTILARISLLETVFGAGNLLAAQRAWVVVFEAIKNCGWATPGFMVAISHLTVGAIEACDGNIVASELDTKIGLTLLAIVGPRYLFVGLATIWMEFIEHLRCKNGGRPAIVLRAELGI